MNTPWHGSARDRDEGLPEGGLPPLPGCARCFAGDAGLARELTNQLPVWHSLADDSHFIVSVRRCPDCSQHYLRIFIEFVDWEGGDDAQYQDTFPLTGEEAHAIAAMGQDIDPSHDDLRYLGSLAAGRWHLSSGWPSGQQRPFTSLGLCPGPLHISQGH